MAFSQSKYINEYNKENYKVYSFRVRKDDIELINFLDNKNSRNQLIISLLKEESKKRILTISEIKELSRDIFKKFGVKKAYLFGSYARGQATLDSDIDIFIEGFDNSIPFGIGGFYLELKEKLGKEIDIVESEANIEPDFFDEIKKDFISLL